MAQALLRDRMHGVRIRGGWWRRPGSWGQVGTLRGGGRGWDSRLHWARSSFIGALGIQLRSEEKVPGLEIGAFADGDETFVTAHVTRQGEIRAGLRLGIYSKESVNCNRRGARGFHPRGVAGGEDSANRCGRAGGRAAN